ncbi:glycosyltransferase family 87 protein [Defluviimonas sp. SAOS-178_SWC]|uniref:glycosyltransferase family 87 protein n=1 Tax=Defluviimonas sp. SAOS-178_SWC TaxID=3121287 RepID=UPI0032214462
MPDRTAPEPRTAFTPRADAILSTVMLGFWAAVTLWQQWGLWAEDLSAVYIAGWLWQNGQPDLIYATPPAFFGGVAESWFPAMEALGLSGKTSFAYVYPPIWAALTAPLTNILSPQGFLDAVALVQIPLLAVSVVLAGRLLKPEAMPWWVWTAIGLVILNLSIQSHVAIWYNQPTITTGFLILLAFERLGVGRPITAGAALALAAAIKLTPAAFVLIFLLDRQVRAAVAFAIVGGALGLMSILLAGWPAHADFLASLHKVASVVYLIAINVSLKPALFAAGSSLGLLPHVDPAASEHIYTDLPAWIGPALSIAAAALILGFARILAPLDGRLRRGVGVLALSIIVALFGPLGWLHYYLMPMLLLPGLLGLLPPRAALAVIAPVSLLSLALVFADIHVPPWPIASYVWLASASWLAVLAGLFVAAARRSAS